MTESSSPCVAIIDDHPLVAAGLAQLLRSEMDAQIVHIGADPLEVLELADSPDIVLLDLDLGPKSPTRETVSRLLATGCAILVVSALASTDQVLMMVESGVAGFVSKAESAETLVEAVRTVLAEGEWTSPEVAALLLSADERPDLSDRERDVLALYARGMKLEAVARKLGIKPGTASTHLRRARRKYAKLGRPASNRVDLYRQVQRDGLIDPEDETFRS